MQIVAQEKGTESTVYVVRDGARQAALVYQDGRCVAAEVVGCLSADEERSFAYEAVTWLGERATDRRSGEYVAIRLAGAERRATA